MRRQLVRYRRRGLDHSDVLLVSYPKSGSTWLRMLLGMTLTGTEMDFDLVREQLPPLGSHRSAPKLLGGSGRVVRTHEILSSLEPIPCRVLYLVRDGRDVAASYYHHVRRVGRFNRGPADFLAAFLAGRIDGYGTWTDHVDAAARGQAAGAVAVLRYEDLRAETADALGRVCDELGVSVTPGAIGAAVAANTKLRMNAKEAQSRVLMAQRSDGSSVVRPDGAPGWRDMFEPDDARRLEEGLAPGLVQFGYR